MAGAGNHAQQLKLLDFVALCEKSAVCVRVDVLGVANSWQARGIRGFVDVSLERTFRRTQWQSDAAGAMHGGVHRETQREAGNSVGRCAIGIGDAGVSLDALCRCDWRRKRLAGCVRWRCAVGSCGESVALVMLCRSNLRQGCLAERGWEFAIKGI